MLRVLTYHRVARPDHSPDLDPRNISATPVAFEQQMQYVRRHCTAVSMDEVARAWAGRRPLPSRAVLITFDDGYRDLLDAALPILEKLGLPATIFVPTAFPDQPRTSFWCDRLFRAFSRTERHELTLNGFGSLPLRDRAEKLVSLRQFQRRLKTMDHARANDLVDRACAALGAADLPGPTVLGWDELRRLDGRGVSICAHSRTHAIMTRLSADAARDEIAGSLSDLRRELGYTLPVYCYPNGDHDDTVVSIARQAGVRIAFTTLDGHNRFRGCDPLRLRRTNMTPRTTAWLLRLRLTRWGAVVDRLRHRMRAA